MASNLDKYRKDLNRLLETGKELLADLAAKASGARTKKGQHLGSEFRSGYQRWYSEAHEVIRQILPGRLDEFERLYNGRGSGTLDFGSYTIQDWLLGIPSGDLTFGTMPFDSDESAFLKFQNQLGILDSAQARFESTLFDIRQLVQADILGSEIEAARELRKNGFLRAAGAVAGVALEKHLGQVCQNHKVTVKKKNPNISDFNDALKAQEVLATPDWRFIQRLGDLRNLCDHDRQREPKDDEVVELVNGVEKIIKTLF